MGIAKDEDNVWVEYKDMLKASGIVKTDNSLNIYKSVQGLVSLAESTQTYIRRKQKQQQADPPNIKFLLSALTLTSSIDRGLAEDLIMLAHGNLDLVHFTFIAGRYQADPKLLSSFFLSAFPREVLDHSEALARELSPLITKLEVPASHVLMLINIFNGKQEGWVALAEIIAVRPSRRPLSDFLALVNWRSVRRVHGSSGHAYRSKFMPLLLELSNKLYGGMQDMQGEFASLMSLVHSVYEGEVLQGLAQLDRVSRLFGGMDEFEIEFVSAIILLLNRKQLSF